MFMKRLNFPVGLLACLLLTSTFALTKIIPSPGSFNLDQLFEQSDIVFVAQVKSISHLEKGSVRASLLPNRFFKGKNRSTPQLETIFEVPSNGPQLLAEGDQALFFLKEDGSGFTPTQPTYARFHITHLAASEPHEGLGGLEADLESGLTDRDKGRVSTNLELLLGFTRLEFPLKVEGVISSDDPQIRVLGHAILLKNGITTHTSEMLPLLESIPPDSAVSVLEIGETLSGLPEPALLPVANQLSRSKHKSLRIDSLQALIRLNSASSVPYLVERLNDRDRYVAFLAVKALAGITGFSDDNYLPAYAVFDKDPTPYLTRWRSWWKVAGQEKYPTRAK
jgi:hypothetical protein